MSLTDEQFYSAIRPLCSSDELARAMVAVSIYEFRAVADAAIAADRAAIGERDCGCAHFWNCPSLIPAGAKPVLRPVMSGQKPVADRAARAEPVLKVRVGRESIEFLKYKVEGQRALPVGDHFLYTAPPAAPVVSGDTIDAVSKALRRAWQLGQTYCRQADHEFVSYHRKADETRAKFDALVEDTRAMLAARAELVECGCLAGECESKPAATCRMTTEIRQSGGAA